MSKNKLCLSIIFDQNYVEPAILTAYELINSKADLPIFLIFIESQDKFISDEIELLLSKFNSIHAVNIIKVNGDILSSFDRFHFNNSIVYKLLIPAILDFDFILNIDAGFLLGSKANYFLFEISQRVANHIYDDSIVAAFCSESAKDLPSSLKSLPHNSKYPSGGFLLFNSQKYKIHNSYDLIVGSYNQLKLNLSYAEQELLCLILLEGQLAELPLGHNLLYEFLDFNGLNPGTTSIAYQGQEFAFYKVCGTNKPWKYWVLDYRKAFYVSRRADLEKVLALSEYAIIVKNRYQVTNEILAQNYLLIFEKKLTDIVL